MRFRLALHIAWPRQWPIFKLGLTLRLGSPTTVCRDRERQS